MDYQNTPQMYQPFPQQNTNVLSNITNCQNTLQMYPSIMQHNTITSPNIFNLQSDTEKKELYDKLYQDRQLLINRYATLSLRHATVLETNTELTKTNNELLATLQNQYVLTDQINTLRKENDELKKKINTFENEILKQNLLIKETQDKNKNLEIKFENLERISNERILKEQCNKYIIAIQDLNRVEQLEKL